MCSDQHLGNVAFTFFEESPYFSHGVDHSLVQDNIRLMPELSTITFAQQFHLPLENTWNNCSTIDS
jgi:hypothetical protein